MQEKSQELKRDLRNALLSTLTEIRQAHLQIDAGPDVERAYVPSPLAQVQNYL